MKNPSAVVDTNIFISGTIIKKGNAYQLISAWRNHRFTLITSPYIITEIINVLGHPKIHKSYPISANQIHRLQQNIIRHSIIIKTQIALTPTVRDPKDQSILSLALQSQADYLVTGDKDLLILKDHPDISPLQIVTVKQFLDQIM